MLVSYTPDPNYMTFADPLKEIQARPESTLSVLTGLATVQSRNILSSVTGGSVTQPIPSGFSVFPKVELPKVDLVPRVDLAPRINVDSSTMLLPVALIGLAAVWMLWGRR